MTGTRKLQISKIVAIAYVASSAHTFAGQPDVDTDQKVPPAVVWQAWAKLATRPESARPFRFWLR
jgi:hypothetical protein